MFQTTWTKPVIVLLGALVLGACGGGNSEPQVASVKPGPMPDGGAWTGVYYSQVYGYLHLISEGSSANGAWRTKAGSEWGELAGEVDGNLFKYSWTNHRIGQVGAAATSSGKGYFVYSIPKEGEAHQIQGEWGLGQDETGNSWEAIKQMNMEPDPDSVKPDEIEGRVQAGGWDDGETEEGADESGETSGDDETEEEEAPSE